MRMSGKLEVVVGIPHPGVVFTSFVQDLTRMMMAYHKYRVGDCKSQGLQLHWAQGSILPRARLKTVRHAIKIDASHVLFLDSDHTFPRNLLHKLILHDKDVVAINHVVKRIPSLPTARNAPGPNDPGYGVPVFTDDDSHGLEKVWRVGAGTMLVKTAVFRKLGEAIFEMTYRPEIHDYQGEDWSMVEAMEAAGYDLYIDHDLSRECGHIGYFTYTHDVVGSVECELPDDERTDNGSGRRIPLPTRNEEDECVVRFET